MFGIGMNEILLVLVLALIVIGPKKLPEIAKMLGRGLAEFKRATEDFKSTIAEESRVTETHDQLLQEGKIRAPGARTDAASSVEENAVKAESASEEAEEKAVTEGRESSHDR